MVMVKHCLTFFFIVFLVIHLTGCATYQESIPHVSTRKNGWFARDKLKHFTASFLIGVAAYSAARWSDNSKIDASIIGFSLSCSCGIAKEITDEVKSG